MKILVVFLELTYGRKQKDRLRKPNH